jgi:hypothetical protein
MHYDSRVEQDMRDREMRDKIAKLYPTPSQQDADAVVTLALYKTTCSLPLPPKANERHVSLIKNHNYTSEQEMSALVDAAFVLKELARKYGAPQPQRYCRERNDHASVITKILRRAPPMKLPRREPHHAAHCVSAAPISV